MKKKQQLDPKTPNWFDAWHNKYFVRVDDRTKRNERWVFAIIIAIIGSGILANGNTDELVGLLKAVFSG